MSHRLFLALHIAGCPQITHMADTELLCTSVQHWPTLDSSVPLNWEIGIGRGSNYETQSKINEPSSQRITSHWSICQASGSSRSAVACSSCLHWSRSYFYIIAKLQLFVSVWLWFDSTSEAITDWILAFFCHCKVSCKSMILKCVLWAWFMLQHTISGVLRESIEKSHIGADLWNCHECYESLPQLS